MIYGALIKSIIGDNPCKCLHVGLKDPSFVASVKKQLKNSSFYITDSDDDQTLPWVNLVGPTTGDIGSGYDMFVVPASAEFFSTAIYIAYEGALKEGGVLVLYGSLMEMKARSDLLIRMIKEGTIAPYSISRFGFSETMLFIMSDGILIRSM